MALVTSAVVLLVGIWFRRRRDRPLLAQSSDAVFTRPWAAAYLLVIVLFWASTVAVSIVQLATGRSEFQTDNAAIVIPGLVAIVSAVLVIIRTAHAIEANDPELQGPIGQLGRFLRVGYGTSALAAFRFLCGRSYP